jgi:hypothetical protein
MVVGGTASWGTEAASELITNPAYLEQGLHNAPLDWQKNNIELVLQTTITDSTTGPPQVEATYFW